MDTEKQEAARILGRIRTEKKAAAARLNGQLGGRPIGPPTKRQRRKEEAQRKKQALVNNLPGD